LVDLQPVLNKLKLTSYLSTYHRDIAMSTDSTNLFDAALQLPDDDRASLAYCLLQSLKPPGISNEDSPAFDALLEERLARYERGESQAGDWDDVATRLRKSLGKKTSS
jgi:putative addiction module component (TIGR02574 family)